MPCGTRLVCLPRTPKFCTAARRRYDRTTGSACAEISRNMSGGSDGVEDRAGTTSNETVRWRGGALRTATFTTTRNACTLGSPPETVVDAPWPPVSCSRGLCSAGQCCATELELLYTVRSVPVNCLDLQLKFTPSIYTFNLQQRAL